VLDAARAARADDDEIAIVLLLLLEDPRDCAAVQDERGAFRLLAAVVCTKRRHLFVRLALGSLAVFAQEALAHAGVAQLAFERRLERMQHAQPRARGDGGGAAERRRRCGREVDRHEDALVRCVRDLPDHEHRPRARAHEPLRGRAEHEVAHEAAAARAQDDQVGRRRVGDARDLAQQRTARHVHARRDAVAVLQRRGERVQRRFAVGEPALRQILGQVGDQAAQPIDRRRLHDVDEIELRAEAARQ